MCGSTTKMTDTPKTSNRRSNKPLMERRRRERINQCLNELKNLVLTAQRKDPTRYSKLEKADILEMTVRHVQSLHKQDTSGTDHRQATQVVTADSTAKYSAGFKKCVSEVSRFLSSINGLPADLHSRVLTHLSSTTNLEYANKKSQIEKAHANDTTSPSKYPSHHQHQTPAQGIPVMDVRLASRQLGYEAPSWNGVSVNSSPPTNATSPEAAGTPSSPESARGSPNMSSSSDESRVHEYPSLNENVNPMRYYQCFPSSTSCPSSSTGNYTSTTTISTGRIQVDLQVAPLDLATSHRRFNTSNISPGRQRATTVTVEALPPQPQIVAHVGKMQAPVSSSRKHLVHSLPSTKGHGSNPGHHALKGVRHVPYPVQNQQNPHWRPW